MSWDYYAAIGLTRTVADPLYVFRYDAKTGAIERYHPGTMGWVDTPSLMRYLVGDDDGFEKITLGAAQTLTANHAAD